MNSRNYNVSRVREVLEVGKIREDMPKIVLTCNAILRSRLGTLGSYRSYVFPSNPPRFELLAGSEIPHYEWMWSENLVRKIRDAKTPGDISSYSMVRSPGGLFIPTRDWFPARGTQVKNCWIVVKNHIAAPDDEWYSQMGDLIMHPGITYKDPLGSPEGPVRMVTQFKTPSEEVTREIVDIVLKDRAEVEKLSERGLLKLAEEKGAELEQKTALNEINKLMPEIDAMGTVFNAIPGKVGSGGVWARGGNKEESLCK